MFDKLIFDIVRGLKDVVSPVSNNIKQFFLCSIFYQFHSLELQVGL